MPSLEQRITDLERQVHELLTLKVVANELAKAVKVDTLGRLDEQGERIAGNSVHLLELYKFVSESVGVRDYGLERRLKEEIR